MYCLYTESGSAHWTRCYILQLQYFVKLISLQAFIGLILKIFDFTVIKNYVIYDGNQKKNMLFVKVIRKIMLFVKVIRKIMLFVMVIRKNSLFVMVIRKNYAICDGD